MIHIVWLMLGFTLLPVTAQLQDDLKKIQSLGQQCVTATIEGDFSRLVDLTYPKLVKRFGGKEKMVAMMEKDSKEMKLMILPTTVNAPTEVLKIGTQKFVILTYQLRLKVPQGILRKNSFLIGILDKPEDSWTFVDGTNLDPAKAKVIFPDAGDKLPLPSPADSVLEKTP
jgi:hypothetical protein